MDVNSANTVNTIKLISISNHTRSKNPLKEGCIKQRCDREKNSMLDLLYNDRNFFYTLSNS